MTTAVSRQMIVAATPPLAVAAHNHLRNLCLFLLDFLHAILTVIPFWWSAILYAPIETFPTSRSYDWFVLHWPHTEPGWSLIFLLFGISGVPGLLPHGSLWPLRFGCTARSIRMGSSACLGLMHITVAWAFVWSNIGGTGSVPYVAFMTMAGVRIFLEDRV